MELDFSISLNGQNYVVRDLDPEEGIFLVFLNGEELHLQMDHNEAWQQINPVTKEPIRSDDFIADLGYQINKHFD